MASHGTLPPVPKQDDVALGHSTVETACPLDCPDTCSLAVSVEQGQIVKIDGSTRQPVTDGYICAKVRRFGDRVYGKDRLHHAGIRLGTKGEGRFKQATWEQALDTIATRITEIRTQFGAEANVVQIEAIDAFGPDVVGGGGECLAGVVEGVRGLALVNIGDLVERLMGKKPELRFQYIQENARFVEELDV